MGLETIWEQSHLVPQSRLRALEVFRKQPKIGIIH